MGAEADHRRSRTCSPSCWCCRCTYDAACYRRLCPIDGGPLNGVDALYATVQMPPGIPVGNDGNRTQEEHGMPGYLLWQILALEFPELEEKLQAYKRKMSDGVAEKAARLKEVGYEPNYYWPQKY